MNIEEEKNEEWLVKVQSWTFILQRRTFSDSINILINI